MSRVASEIYTWYVYDGMLPRRMATRNKFLNLFLDGIKSWYNTTVSLQSC